MLIPPSGNPKLTMEYLEVAEFPTTIQLISEGAGPEGRTDALASWLAMGEARMSRWLVSTAKNRVLAEDDLSHLKLVFQSKPQVRPRVSS